MLSEVRCKFRITAVLLAPYLYNHFLTFQVLQRHNMNVVQEIKRINAREQQFNKIVGGSSGSWHDDYRDSHYIFVGGLPYELTEGDLLIVFSQYAQFYSRFL